MVTITDESFKKILYHIDSSMGLFGFGGEYSKMVKLCKELNLENYNLSEFPNIKRVINAPIRKDIEIKSIK
jgi:hypothetical protein